MSALASSVRLLTGVLVVAVVSFLAGPWVLYGVGLHAAGGRPEPPARIAPVGEQLAFWEKERGVGEPRITPRNPFTYRAALADPGPERPGLKAAFSIASHHLRENARYQGRYWWHLSSSALTIWLTRNWSIEEILSKAVELRDARGARRQIARPPYLTGIRESSESAERALV